MKPLTIKAKVIQDYNDSKNNGKLVEEGSIIELDYARYEQLKSIGKVEEYKEPIKLIKKEEKEDE